MPLRMSIRAVRGAITASENSREAILAATRELLLALIEANRIDASAVIAATFSVTADLDQAYPAEAARNLEWTEAGLLCVQEMRVQGTLDRCIRVRVLWETERPQSAMKHCYLGGASDLRPDLLEG